MADASQRQRLRELVAELHSCIEVPDLEAATEVLASSVTSRNIANVTALTNKRKLSERSPDPPKVDALYAELKDAGNQPVTDRFINVLLKLREAPGLLAVVADPVAAQRQADAALEPAPAPAPAPLTGGEAHELLGARLAARGPAQSSQASSGLRLNVDAGGSEAGGFQPRPTDSDPALSGQSRVPAAVAAATPVRDGARGREPLGGTSGGTPVLPARNLGLQSKKGMAVPMLPDWTRDRPFLTGDAARLAVDSPLLMPLPDASQRPAPMPISTFPHTVQEIMIVEEILSALTGIEGKFIRASTTKLGRLTFSVDNAIDPSLADLTARILPLACHAHAVNRYIDVHSRFEYGTVCHAFCAGLRHVLKEFYVLVCQLEHQFTSEQLSLQKLWFYVQPTLRIFALLDRVVSVLVKTHSVGGALLNVVHSQVTAIGGSGSDDDTTTTLRFLLRQASAPFFEILGRWIYEGRIDDPYDEFFIEEQTLQARTDMMEVYDESYWHRKFTVREEMLPLFIAHMREQIFNAGKFLHVLRSCDMDVQSLLAKQRSAGAHKQADSRVAPIEYMAHAREYTAGIELAYSAASKVLIEHVMGELQLKQRLTSLKRFFLLDQGDFLLHFMDVAEAELCKNVGDISMPKLRSLLDSALRGSTASQDAFCDDLTCELLPYTLISQLLRVISVRHERGGEGGVGSSLPAASLAHQGQVTGIEAFTFDYKVEWPLSLVLSKYALTKYQLLFRHLFHCKNLERLLSATWQTHQTSKQLEVARGRAFSLSFQLRQRMLHFLHNFLYYMMFEVLEPNWHTMMERLKDVSNIDEVIAHHDAFLDTCMKECMLHNPQLLKILTKLMSTCIIFANHTERFTKTLTLDLEHPPDENLPDVNSGLKPPEVRSTLCLLMKALDLLHWCDCWHQHCCGFGWLLGLVETPVGDAGAQGRGYVNTYRAGRAGQELLANNANVPGKRGCSRIS
jgi:hypothetical protein